MTRLRLRVLPHRLAVCRLAPDAPIPAWPRGAFTSITRTPDELSIVCDDDAVPHDVQCERGRRVLVVEGPLPFNATGIAAAMLAPLADARIPVLLISTYDTDYLMIEEALFDRGLAVLRAAGHDVN